MNRFLFAALVFGLLANCDGIEINPDEAEALPPKSAAEVQFVKGVFNALQAQSFAENREYCGYIGLNSAGALVATPARRGGQASCRPKQTPMGFRIIASYHTHGAYSDDYDTEVPSSDDLRADIREGVDGYIATPGGRIWYNDFANEQAILECGVDCVISDVNFVEYERLPVGTRFDLDALLGRENS